MKTKKEIAQDRDLQILRAKKLIEKAKSALDNHGDHWTAIIDELFRSLLEDAKSATTKALVITDILEERR